VERIAVDETTRMAQKATDHAVAHMESWATHGAPEERMQRQQTLSGKKHGLARSMAGRRRPSNRKRPRR